MKPIKRVPIVQQAEDQIRTLIESGEYEPGEKLPVEMELCQRLGVGRGTVREAFRLLEAKGYVEIKAGRGAFVAQHQTREALDAVAWLLQNEIELREFIEVRSALEPLAARHMAEQGSDQDIQALTELFNQFIKALQKQDSDRIACLDEQFHSAIVEGSGNHLLTTINQLVCQGIKTFRDKTFQVPHNIQNAVEPHTRIMEAILARDGQRAEQEMRAHLDKVGEDLSLNINGSQSVTSEKP